MSSDTKSSDFHPIFYPRSIAVVGASPQGGKVGNFVLRSVLYSGIRNIYPVHAGGAKEILGLKAYSSIADIPDDNVDLFLFAIPHQHILPSFESAIARGCRGAVIFTAGFREADEQGKAKQEILRDMANQAGVKIIGPNTLGFFRSDNRLNATFIPTFSDHLTEAGRITVISQSGGVGCFTAVQFIEDRLPVGTLVCLGNRANVEFADILGFCETDPQTSVIALFIEGIEDLRNFYHAAKKCASRKPVIVLGAGYTEAGRKAARSHTGSMASSQAIYEAVFRQAGLIQVQSVEELVDTAKILLFSSIPKGNRVAIVTHTAGPAILASDVLAQNGFVLAELDDGTKKELASRNMLPSFMSPDNPIDMTTFGYLDRKLYVDVVNLLSKDPNVDCSIFICMSSLGDANIASFPVEQFGKAVKRSQKPAVFVWGAPLSFPEEFSSWIKEEVPVYPNPERAARAMVNLFRYSQISLRKVQSLEELTFSGELEKLIEAFRSSGKRQLLEHEAKQIVELAGIRVARAMLAKDEQEAIEIAGHIGYPVAIKVVAAEIIHKSDVGGVWLDIQNEEQLRFAFRKMTERVMENMPEAKLQGITVQPMLPRGTEIIVGTFLDAQAGPVVMFGLGGIWVEVLKDVTFRLAPVELADAREMIEEIKGVSILSGFRGQHPVDKETLAHMIVRVSHLATHFGIKELDLNPIIFYDDTYAVADARIIL